MTILSRLRVEKGGTLTALIYTIHLRIKYSSTLIDPGWTLNYRLLLEHYCSQHQLENLIRVTKK